MAATPQETSPALAVASGQAPLASPTLAQLLGRRAPALHLLREPTFDELVTGSGRHRDVQELQESASPLRRLALRARLLPAPARRPAAHPAGTP